MFFGFWFFAAANSSENNSCGDFASIIFMDVSHSHTNFYLLCALAFFQFLFPLTVETECQHTFTSPLSPPPTLSNHSCDKNHIHLRFMYSICSHLCAMVTNNDMNVLHCSTRIQCSGLSTHSILKWANLQSNYYLYVYIFIHLLS